MDRYTRLDKFVAELADIVRTHDDDELSRRSIQHMITSSLDYSYARNIMYKLFELPEYDDILGLARRLHYKIYRNDQGIHRLEFVGRQKVYVNR